MARRTNKVTISEAGRDKGKTFLLTELPADQAERWAIRCLLAIANSGSKLPDDALEAGMAGLALTVRSFIVVGLRSLQGMRYDDVGDLLDEMLGCIQYCPPGGLPPQKLFEGENCQIEEVATRLTLRWEVLQLHINFSLAEGALSMGAAQAPPVPPPST